MTTVQGEEHRHDRASHPLEGRRSGKWFRREWLRASVADGVPITLRQLPGAGQRNRISNLTTNGSRGERP